MRDSTLPRGCLLLLMLVAATFLVDAASQNDDLVFDQDGKQSLDEIPLIETRQQDSILHRLRRGLFDFFNPTTSTSTEPSEPGENNADNELDNDPLVQSNDDEYLEKSAHDTADEFEVEADEDNEVGNAAEGRRESANFGNSDDEDLAGSGEMEGSADDTRLHSFIPIREEKKYYRITLTVGEPFRREYVDRNSREYKELSGNLTQPLEELLNRYIPNESHHANVIKISPTSDSFTSQVTLDIGSTFTDEMEVRNVIEQQLHLHSLGNVQVRPEEFSFRVFQGCSPGEFACDVSRCILASHRCNFIKECDDGSDEYDCSYPACTASQFKCRNEQCVDSSARCNGVNDCSDHSDELNCLTTCSGDQFRCLDGTCISIDKRCNHNIDCRNGEDEKQCGCGATEFRCTDGRCIGYELQCNGVEECSDGSDERDCDLAPCPSMDFTCSDGSCILKSSVCDGFDDCPRAEDELHCERECTPTQFKCITGNKCIEGIYRCDGQPDCPDQSDEDCANETITHATPPISQPWPGGATESRRECDPSKEMRCDDGQCILLRRKCDNIFDCLDGSDERGCGVCSPAEWKCASGECIAEIERCDNVIHCADGSDESGCECPDGQLPCDNKVCINKNFFCDNNIDCHDGSDERDCNNAVTQPPRCREDEFTCRDGTCIPQSALCDERPDCPYAEDEANCLQGKNTSDRTNLVGLIHETRDNKDYNPDYQAPANHSTPRSCAPDDFVCADGTCIPETHHCDHFYDCRDFTDEQYCFG